MVDITSHHHFHRRHSYFATAIMDSFVGHVDRETNYFGACVWKKKWKFMV